MKRYNDLTQFQKNEAKSKCLHTLINNVLMNIIRFDDEKNSGDLQQRIDNAIAKASNLKTPWFAATYLMNDKVVKETLESIAVNDAFEAFYPDHNEVVVRLVGIK